MSFEDFRVSQFERPMSVQSEIARRRGPVTIVPLTEAPEMTSYSERMQLRNGNSRPGFGVPYADAEPVVIPATPATVRNLGEFAARSEENVKPKPVEVDEPLVGDFTD